MRNAARTLKLALGLVLALWAAALPPLPAKAADTMSVAAVGDIMMGTTFPEPFLPPGDGAGLFDAVRDAWEGCDLVFGNLEGPMIDGGRSDKCGEGKPNCYAFRMPERYAGHLKRAGFTALGIINNHAYDFGAEGVASTVRALKSVGLSPVGGSETAVFSVKGKKVAVAGFCFPTHSTYGSRYFYSITDIPAARRVVRELCRDNDIVIVSFHGGAEGKDATHVTGDTEIYLGEDRGNVRAFAHAVVDAGADLVIGHGPHVLRGAEIYKGRLIAYSLGNFLTYGGISIRGVNGVTAILTARLDLETGAFVSGRLVSARQVERGVLRKDPENAGALLVRDLSRADFPGSGLDVSGDGDLVPEGGEK